MILYGSDLHLTNWNDTNYFEIIINPLLKKYNKKELEQSILILAWDFSEQSNVIMQSITFLLKHLPLKQILITFWNHDLYLLWQDKVKFNSSLDKYKFLLKTFNKIDKITVLDLNNYEHEWKVIVWNMWWYDPMKNISQHEMKILQYYGCTKDNFNNWSFLWFKINDKNYIQWKKITQFEKRKIIDIFYNLSFEKFSDKFFQNKLIKQLEEKLIETKWKEIICVSHYCPDDRIEFNSEFYVNKKILNKITNDNKDVYKKEIRNLFSNYFFVNNQIGKLYKKYKIKQAIYWHTHYWVDWVEIDWTKYYSNPYWYNWYDWKYDENFIIKELK